ncbi:MAG: hypothetical protein HXY24_15710 [Rubrivivax sp.]|nr:hypothetical protein [Rubrivivax sp.]
MTKREKTNSKQLMRKTNILIVGGSAAGATAALTSQRHYFDKEVLLVRQEKPVSRW